MQKADKTEVWLRGPVNDVPYLLQPVAHALLQARNELNEMMEGFPEKYLWDKVAGMAAVGFHLQHLAGVLDRLFTYARGEALNTQQLAYLAGEGKDKEKNARELLVAFNIRVDKAIRQLSETDVKTLTETRGVGRAQIPSTIIGLLVHSAEHTMRHIGQLLVTVKVIEANIQML